MGKIGVFLKGFLGGLSDATVLPAVVKAAKEGTNRVNWVRLVTSLIVIVLLVLVAMGKITVEQFLEIEKAID